MKVLVLGGTGAMGVHLTQLLSLNRIETVVTSRTFRVDAGTVHYRQGNAHNIKFITEILEERWDVIIDFMVYSTSSFEERVHSLLNATSQYIFLSSGRVYADSKKKITENSPRLLDVTNDKEFLSTDEYSLTKARQENILSNTKYKNWTIIRPYITYDKNRLQLGVLEKEQWLYRALKGRTIVFSNEINSKITTLTYGLDVSRGIMAVINNSKALGEIFNIVSNDSNTWKDILDVYLRILEKHLGYKPKVLLQNLKKFSKCNKGKYQIQNDRVFNRKFNNSKIQEYIDTSSFIEIDMGLKSCLEEFLKNPKFNNIDWRAEALRDKESKEFTSLIKFNKLKSKVKYLIYRFL